MPNKPWLVFGLDGRNESDVRNAVQLGYRRFDAAESYGASTDALAREISDSGMPRTDFEVLYKFDVRPDETPEQLRGRLTDVAARFGGKLEAVVIHNLDGDNGQIREAWNVMRDMKRDGQIGKLGVGNVLPEHASLLRELKTKEPIDVVQLSPLNSPQGSQRGSQQGSQQGSPKGADRTLGETSSDRSSPLIGVVENSVRSVLANPELQPLMAELGDRTTLYYYNVVNTLQEIQQHYDQSMGAGNAPDMRSQDAMTAVAQLAGSHVEGPSHMILSSGDPDRARQNLEAYRGDPIDLAITDYQKYVYDWAQHQEVCRTNDETLLPDGVLDKVRPLFDDPATNRARAAAFAGRHADGNLTRETMSRWLMQEHGFTREELEGVTVPDRVGLKPQFQNMKLADVLAGHLGPQNCNHKWANELGYALMNDAATWNSIGPTLTEIAKDPNTLRTPSPLSMAEAASLTGGRSSGAPSPGTEHSPGGTHVPPPPVRTPSPTR
ncbi:aldo/keto reductase [Streptomyces sp. NPDC091280]|uniref:aldo/keto reductase n=1 Tax=Streptomyces sp. NPDC091280 TaxID=3365984 RepID=UPI00381BA397